MGTARLWVVVIGNGKWTASLRYCERSARVALGRALRDVNGVGKRSASWAVVCHYKGRTIAALEALRVVHTDRYLRRLAVVTWQAGDPIPAIPGVIAEVAKSRKSSRRTKLAKPWKSGDVAAPTSADDRPDSATGLPAQIRPGRRFAWPHRKELSPGRTEKDYQLSLCRCSRALAEYPPGEEPPALVEAYEKLLRKAFRKPCVNGKSTRPVISWDDLEKGREPLLEPEDVAVFRTRKPVSFHLEGEEYEGGKFTSWSYQRGWVYEEEREQQEELEYWDTMWSRLQLALRGPNGWSSEPKIGWFDRLLAS